MSNKIYFSDKKDRKSFNFYLIKMLSTSLHFIAPALAKKQTKKLLLTPMISKKIKFAKTDFKQVKQEAPYGDLNLYRTGSGRKVILTHGWSGGASQFFPLMQKIADAGFEAIAFDHYGHGKSSGQFANLPLFVKGLNAIIEHEGKNNIACIISHSMGTVAALNQDKSLNHLLIAPTFGFYQSFEKRILSTGIKSNLFHNMLADVEQEHQLKFKDLLPEQHLAKTQGRIHIVHDQGDRFAPFDLAKQQVESFEHVSFTATSGLGHGRVINSDPTWEAFQKLAFN
ncbi:alpha/beta hydrolase [Pseudoalteromonas denitrificans]|jgi:pimeloyl-ACP methyl ester carboxylesterase|uniref:Serine aminopeptidase, S33 n=1 Tax=Pseudoalteromonas denitrificans DSM 6059 TaxID=1123010 RepID=A0A1I1S012_9GAMM|nr:alpha/beta hydrolase [Pseudoalteromonas denitrificans]SFD39865.1 Serine aminopeptidase, S33 [Pseudoalteromonas denitrificans DSM 6059]